MYQHHLPLVQDVAQQCQVRAMPTFHVYSGGQKVEEIVGANLNALKAACEKYEKASSVFQGTGHTLSGQTCYMLSVPVLHANHSCMQEMCN